MLPLVSLFSEAFLVVVSSLPLLLPLDSWCVHPTESGFFFLQSNLILYIRFSFQSTVEKQVDGWGGRRRTASNTRRTSSTLRRLQRLKGWEARNTTMTQYKSRYEEEEDGSRGSLRINKKEDTSLLPSSFGHKIEWDSEMMSRRRRGSRGVESGGGRGIDFLFDPTKRGNFSQSEIYGAKRREEEMMMMRMKKMQDEEDEEEDFQLRDCCDPCVTIFDVDTSSDDAEYLPLRVDAFSRVFVPLFFLIFCAYYWPTLLKNEWRTVIKYRDSCINLISLHKTSHKSQVTTRRDRRGKKREERERKIRRGWGGRRLTSLFFKLIHFPSEGDEIEKQKCNKTMSSWGYFYTTKKTQRLKEWKMFEEGQETGQGMQ